MFALFLFHYLLMLTQNLLVICAMYMSLESKNSVWFTKILESSVSLFLWIHIMHLLFHSFLQSEWRECGLKKCKYFLKCSALNELRRNLSCWNYTSLKNSKQNVYSPEIYFLHEVLAFVNVPHCVLFSVNIFALFQTVTGDVFWGVYK